MVPSAHIGARNRAGGLLWKELAIPDLNLIKQAKQVVRLSLILLDPKDCLLYCGGGNSALYFACKKRR